MNLLVHQCFLSFSSFLHTGVCDVSFSYWRFTKTKKKKNLLLVYLYISLSLSRNLESKCFLELIFVGVREIRE